MTVDVIMPTIGTERIVPAIASLTYLPFPIRLHVIVGKPFPEAVNEGLSRAKGDVLLMDDDVRLTSKTFKDFAKHYDHADVFGFKLTFPDGRIQHAGGWTDGQSVGHIGYGMTDGGEFNKAYEVCHVTSALVYYKRHVYKAVGDFDVSYSPSASLSDVDYSFRAIKAGYTIRYLPGPAIHDETPKTDPVVLAQIYHNLAKLRANHLCDTAFNETVRGFPRGVRI